MPTATEAKVFDTDLFVKRVRMVDSAQGDGVVAARQAIKQCAQCDPPRLFYEAVLDVFGSHGSKDDSRLLERATRAEAEVAELKKASINTKKRLEQQEQFTEELRLANLELASQLEEALKVGGTTGRWPSWELLEADFLTIFICMSVLMEWVLGICIGPGPQYAPARRVLHENSIGFFVLWLAAAYNTMNLRKLLMRLGMWAAGWAGAGCWILWRHGGSASQGDLFTYWVLPTNWWAAYVLNPEWNDFWIIFVFLYVIWETNNKWEFTNAVTMRIRNIFD